MLPCLLCTRRNIPQAGMDISPTLKNSHRKGVTRGFLGLADCQERGLTEPDGQHATSGSKTGEQLDLWVISRRKSDPGPVDPG